MSLLARRSILSSRTFVDPSSDPLLFSWWDTTDFDNINFTESNNRVNFITPSAGSSSVVLQQVGGSRPRVNIRTLNSLNVINYDGTDFLKSFTTMSLPTSGNLMIMMVAIVDVVNSADDSIWSLEATADCQLDAANATQFDGTLDQSGIGSDSAVFTDRPFSAWAIFTTVFDFVGDSTHSTYVDAVSQYTPATYTTKLDTTIDFMTFSNRNETAFPDGAHADIIITENITDSMRNNHREYLEDKYAI